MTILLYINSVFQAVSLFALYFLFDYGRSGHVKQRDPTDPITHEKATVYALLPLSSSSFFSFCFTSLWRTWRDRLGRRHQLNNVFTI
jgi:hypothetical protein